VEDEATLTCHWDPLIPFSGSALDQRITVRLAPTAVLYWSDAFMSGRQGKGERWEFSSLAHELRVSRGGVLEYLERYRIEPGGRSAARPWVAADAAYFGTALVSGPAAAPALAEQLHHELAAAPGVTGSADVLGEHLLLVRLMGTQGPAFHAARLRGLSALSPRF
jgi:urease accessory protein UreH